MLPVAVNGARTPDETAGPTAQAPPRSAQHPHALRRGDHSWTTVAALMNDGTLPVPNDPIPWTHFAGSPLGHLHRAGRISSTLGDQTSDVQRTVTRSFGRGERFPVARRL